VHLERLWEPSPGTPEAVRAEIVRTRQHLAASVAALKREVALCTEWREWVRASPRLFIAGAFLLGLALGHRIRSH